MKQGVAPLLLFFNEMEVKETLRKPVAGPPKYHVGDAKKRVDVIWTRW
jgi:hypothetical protein